MKRLTDQEEADAKSAFAEYMYPDVDFPEGFLEGLEVLYRDDEDTGKSWYQVVDSQGHGDGSGEWTEVK